MTNHIYDDDPFYIAILGDFSGRSNNQRHDVTSLPKRSFIEVNLDNIDRLIADLNIQLQLWPDDDCDEAVSIPVNSLDDFHPDRIFSNVEIFSRLMAFRDCVGNAKTFEITVSKLRQKMNHSNISDISSPGEMSVDKEQLTEEKYSESSKTMASNVNPELPAIDDLLCKILAQHLDIREDVSQEEFITAFEHAISSHMQFILHHPDYQALEAAWRSVEFLLQRLKTGERLRFYIKDITQHELELDLSNEDITRSSIYECFCNKAPGNVAWGLILGNYQFRDRVEDIMTLLHMGAIARRAQAPFISAVNERLVGCESFAVTPEYEDWSYKPSIEVKSAWSLLRDSDEAGFLSLVLPGFLLRMPYGANSKPIESFEFEEMPEVNCHSCYLWGNGAFIKTEQLARAFLNQGWDMDPSFIREVDCLPLHIVRCGNEKIQKPCAEVHLPAPAIDKIIQLGLIPLRSVKNSDVIRSEDFHFLST